MNMNRLLIVALFVLLMTAATAVAGRNQAEDVWEQADKAAQAGRYEEAIRLYRRSLALCGVNEHDCTSSNLSGIGAAYDALNQNEKALEYYRASLKVDRQRNSKPDIALALLNVGAVLYKGLERHSEALPVLQESLGLFRSLGKQEETALVLTHLASIRTIQGNYAEALRHQEEALSIARRLKDKFRLADTLSSMGNTANLLGRYVAADRYLKEALTLLRKMNEPGLLSSTLNYKGLNDFDLGRTSQALAAIDEALSIAGKLKDSAKASNYTNNLGVIQMKIGQYDRARSYYRNALNLAVRGKHTGLQATALSNLGQVENAVANYEASIEYTRQALQLNRSLGRNNEIAINLNNIGKSYYDMGRYDEALPWHNQALAARRIMGNPVDIAASLDNIGATYLFMGDLPKAEQLFQDRRRMQSQTSGIRLRNPGLAEAWLQAGRYADALQLLNSEPLGNSAGEPAMAEYEMMLGRALAGIGRLQEGSLKLLSAYRILEDLRSSSSDRGAFLKGGGAGGRYRTYRALTAVMAERALHGETGDPSFRGFGQNLADVAFTFSETTKTRSLLERIAGQGNRKLAEAKLPNDYALLENHLKNSLAEMDAAREQALRGGGANYKQYLDDRLAISKELDVLVDRMRREHPLYAALNYPRPVSPNELPLSDNELLLAYAVGEDASYLFVTRKGGVRKVLKIALRRDELEEKVKTLLEPFLTRQPEKFSIKAAEELYKLLLAEGVSAALPSDRIIIVPDGILGTVPFEILVSKAGKDASSSIYAGDSHMFTYYQSASLLSLKRVMPAGEGTRPLFALGNPVFSGTPAAPGSFRGLAAVSKTAGQRIEFPPLPETETEVRKIAALYGVDTLPPHILIGADATEQELKKVPLGEYRYLHFATHASLPGLIKEVNEPFILLGQNRTGSGNDGFLTLSEVLNLRLQAEMVMLSACLTGAGRDIEGEGVANFARAFQSAGAKRVVVSLWEVASEPAVEYVTAYYAALKSGKGHLPSLKAARDMMRKKLPHPYYWGVFILHGEG